MGNTLGEILDEILLFLNGPPPGAKCGNCRWFHGQDYISLDGRCHAEPPASVGNDLSGFPFFTRPTVWNDELCRHWRAVPDAEEGE